MTARTALLIVVTWASVFALLGGIAGQTQLYEHWAQQKSRRITAVVPLADYPGLETGHPSDGHAYLSGTVPDEATRAGLRELLIPAFGREEAEAIVRPVDVRR